MPTYNAPVDDMMFLFDKLRNNKKYNEIEKYKEVNTELVKDILAVSYTHLTLPTMLWV